MYLHEHILEDGTFGYHALKHDMIHGLPDALFVLLEPVGVDLCIECFPYRKDLPYVDPPYDEILIDQPLQEFHVHVVCPF